MSAPSPKAPLRQPSGSNDDTKTRGANRSTKVAGKLKVLPEHPEPAPVPTAKRELLAPSKDKGTASTEGSASTDEEEETEDADAEDVKVRFSARCSTEYAELTALASLMHK